MSTSSAHHRISNHRLDSVRSFQQHSREGSRTYRRAINHHDAYSYALRVAFLSYLLQPRARRIQHVPAPPQPVQRSSTSFNDLMKDFSLLRDAKSTRFPHGFVAELEKRLTKVLMGRESRKEYQEAIVKRTFAAFLNAFSEPSFKKRMEKDRRAEDLVLIFFSNATKELQKGKPPEDDSWKLMVDRHVALFVRLIGLVLKENDWARERPELTTRLTTLESKLLIHDQDLTETRNGGGKSVEVIVPLSYDIKDMPHVQVVARVFGLTYAEVQSDINKNKAVWTERAALQDLKAYQTHLNLSTGKTLSNEDFDVDEAYESWKKGEGPDLSQMMLAIVQSNPELAKTTSGEIIPQFNPQNKNGTSDPSLGISKTTSWPSEKGSYAIDQPVDMSTLNLGDEGTEGQEGDNVYTFIPPDPRSYLRFIVLEVLRHDLKDQDLQPSEATADRPSIKLLSKQSTELLNEICLRWRIPAFSRMVLFMDAIKEKYIDQEIDLETLDAAFLFIKEPPSENRRSSVIMSNTMSSALYDRSKWTIADYASFQKVLLDLNDGLLRELYAMMLQCYEKKPPNIGPIMYILENHIYDDPSFSKSPEDLDRFSDELAAGLQQRAKAVYGSLVEANVPQDEDSWEFYHVIQLGKSVLSTFERIQKRYRKNPEIMG